MKFIIRYIAILFLFLIQTNFGFAQNTDLQNITETLAENTSESADLITIFEDLEYYAVHPLNINTASRQELSSLNILTGLQVQNIRNHIIKYGLFIEPLEIQAVEGISLATLKQLLPYIRTGAEVELQNITLQNLIEKGSNELVIRQQRILQSQRGFTIRNGDSATAYVGSPDKIFMRYKYNFGNKVLAGFTAEKDAGEAFGFTQNKKGFDFLSGHVTIKNIGKIKMLVVGDYSLAFGQGLALQAGLAFGKSPAVDNIKRNAYGLKPFTSANEFAYFRGVANTLQFKQLAVTYFYSSQKIDGRLNADTIENTIDGISTIYTSGFHRTTSEINFKNALNRQIIGTNVNLVKKKYSFGGTFYNLDFKKSGTSLSSASLAATNASVASIDGSFNFKNAIFFGEAATNLKERPSFLAGYIAALDPKVTLSMLYRNYKNGNILPLGNAFGENTRNENETGLYTGVKYSISRRNEIAAFVDIYRFPKPKYLVDLPSVGSDVLVQYSYNPQRSFKTYVRGRYRMKQKNFPENTTRLDYLTNTESYQLRFNADYKISPAVSMSSRIETNWYTYEKFPFRRGYYIAQDIKFAPLSSKISFNGRFAMFDATNYENRFYAYEDDILYAYTSSLVNGVGTRYFIIVHYKAMKGLDFYAKYSTTNLYNTRNIGSGNDEIQGNIRSEIKLQMRVLF